MYRSVGKTEQDAGVATTRDSRIFFTPAQSCQAQQGFVPGTDHRTRAHTGRCLTPGHSKLRSYSGARHSTELCLALVLDEASTHA